MGTMFMMILAFETFYGRFRIFQPRQSEGGACAMNLRHFRLGLLMLALFGGIIRVGTPYLFVSLGECITERSGRVNLGLEGTLFMGAMTGYGVSLSDAARPGSASCWLPVPSAYRSVPCMRSSATCRASTSSPWASP